MDTTLAYQYVSNPAPGWTDPIRHGRIAHASKKSGLPWWHPFFQLNVDINVSPDESIGARLAQQGLEPKDLQAVVVSHLHHDHGDGLADLADARILVAAEHWAAFRKKFSATILGAAPQYWPEGFQPELLQLENSALGPWEKTYPITSDGRVIGIPTPGHVPGHMSVVVFADEATYLLGGDVTYDQELLDQEQTDGVNGDPHLAVEQLRKIKTFAATRPVVLLPAHDPNAASRLNANTAFRPSALKPTR